MRRKSNDDEAPRVRWVQRPARSVVTLLAAVALAACAAPQDRDVTPSSASGAAATPRSAAAAELPTPSVVEGVINCKGAGTVVAVRPELLAPNCRAELQLLFGLRWDSWGGPTAYAGGTLRVNPCTPNCVESGRYDYPSGVLLSAPAMVDGRYVYTLMKVTTENGPVLISLPGE